LMPPSPSRGKFSYSAAILFAQTSPSVPFFTSDPPLRGPEGQRINLGRGHARFR
jgi:hypothetical protein